MDKAQVTQCTVEGCTPNGSVAEAESQTIVSSIKIKRIHIVEYENEYQMVDIMRLITKVLSEPYSIYTYRYFIHNWPKLCLLVSLLQKITVWKKVILQDSSLIFEVFY